MKTSTNRGHRCARQALARLAEAELFRQFQYLTVPLAPVSDLQIRSLLTEDDDPGVTELPSRIARASERVLDSEEIA